MSDTEDPDAIFAAIMEGVVLEEPTDVVDITTLTKLEIVHKFNEVRQALFELGEMHQPRTQRGRDLHSQREALLVEQRKRGMV